MENPNAKMEQPRLLFTLPTSLSAEILSSWLLAKDLVNLDSAHCNYVLRPPFLKLIGSQECAFKLWELDGFGTTNEIVGWATKRNVFLRRISFWFHSDLEKYGPYVKKLGSCILEARVMDVPSCVIKSVPFCPNLVHLELSCGFSVGPRLHYKLCNLHGATCPNLKVIQVNNCEDPILLAELVKAAINSDTLVLKYCQLDIDEKMYELGEVAELQHAGTEHARSHPTNVLDVVSNTVTTFSILREDTEPSFYLALGRMLGRCQKLVHLGLPGGGVTSGFIQDNILQWQRLTSVDLSLVSLDTCDVIDALVDACKDTLTELLLCRCDSLSTEAISTVLQQCTKLTTFGADSSEKLSCICDASLLGRCTSLTLRYDGTVAKTVAFIASIAEHCPLLEELQLFIINEDVPPSSLDVLVTKCTRLRALNVKTREIVREGPLYGLRDLDRWCMVRPDLTVREMFSAQLTVLRKLQSEEIFTGI